MSSEDHSHHATGIAGTIVRLFFKGLATIIPIALTLLIVFWLAGLAEGGIGSLIQLVLPESWYIRGMGLFGGIIIVIVIGLLSQVLLFQKLIDFGEAILARMPVVKSVYRATKDFVEYFSGDDEGKFNQVVLVRHPGLEISLLGFVTREDFSNLPFGKEDEVAVYLPLSYQIAGYTIFVPREWCEPVDMPFEDAVRLILTAAMTRRGS
ncbi:DUF502 domain-containing protein [Wenzhouxiangella sp. AB-CW3]|uniref:DUF502 domain-containing protein n=1 Tax=Wenzhouxiangella sp. AB-CW3 TaxID=2771012 RepID=UPI00168B610D|nr:DUF502 domain-containing protein [Wenzhouxiangella sp. AB-CW3]QOC21320.1 DUF502 domain-containing protein [Wenzhouxiangella sp. AB-CW3]